jgi:hypothetical protein
MPWFNTKKGFNTDGTKYAERIDQGRRFQPNHGFESDRQFLFGVNYFQIGIFRRALPHDCDEGRGGARQRAVAAVDEP